VVQTSTAGAIAAALARSPGSGLGAASVFALGLAVCLGIVAASELGKPPAVPRLGNMFPRFLPGVVFGKLPSDLALNLLVHVIHLTPHDVGARARAYMRTCRKTPA
jgi:hypothetical protein